MDYTLKKYSIFTAKGLKALNSYIEDGATKLGLYINKTNMLKRDRYDIKHWNICKTQEETMHLINATLDWIEGTYWMHENYNIEIINDKTCSGQNRKLNVKSIKEVLIYKIS